MMNGIVEKYLFICKFPLFKWNQECYNVAHRKRNGGRQLLFEVQKFFCNIEDFRIIVCYFIMKGEPQWN
mgnify:FL=1